MSSQRSALRPAGTLMTGPRLGALQPTRLSASRSLVNRMITQGWRIACTRFDLDDEGAGVAVYEIDAGGQQLCFVAYSSRPSLVDRTPRIIGSSWDMLGALMEGPADEQRIRHTAGEMPKLYAGRAAPGSLVWCRANRSLRAFDVTVSALADGAQPDPTELFDIGYLMRNTGLDGNGTFGTRTFLDYGADHPLRTPYHAQMLTAYLMREFSFDLVDHIARQSSGTAVALAPETKRYLGLGNGSGLGLVLFSLNHPVLAASWLRVREQALARARSLELAPDAPELARLESFLGRTIRYRREDTQRYGVFPQSLDVARELEEVRADIVAWRRGRPPELRTADPGTGPACVRLGTYLDSVPDRMSPEAQETVNALAIELVPEAADELLEDLVVDETLGYDPTMTVGRFRSMLEDRYGWALEWDMRPDESRTRIWYKSRAAEEPRSGPRREVPRAFDLGTDMLGDIRRLADLLRSCSDTTRMGEVLGRHPDQRNLVQRLYTLRTEPYGFPRVDIRTDDFIAAWLIRLGNGAFYGLDRTKDFMNRNLRGLIFHGAPLRDDLAEADPDGWWHPARPEPSRGTA